jgi:lipoprotein-anchoring transpeptidase ErfK/SrfK
LFSTQESQGCVNLTIADGAYLCNLTGASTPVVILD